MTSDFNFRFNISEMAASVTSKFTAARAPLLPAALCLMLAVIPGCGGPAAGKAPPKKIEPNSDPAYPGAPKPPVPVNPDKPDLGAVVIMLPFKNSQSPASEIVVSGTCVTGRQLTLGGAVIVSEVIMPLGLLTQVCLDSRFSFAISKLMDGVFPFTVTQPGNLPADPVSVDNVTWTKDSVGPTAISISKPAGGSVRNSSNSLVIAGDCEAGAQVLFSGASDGNVPCHGGGFSFEITATTDAVRLWVVKQIDLAGNASTGVTVQWAKDSSQPLAPVILTPVMNSYSSNQVVVISGTCQSGFEVHLTGAASTEVTMPAGALEQICSSATFSYSVKKSTDGPFDFSVTQTDLQTGIPSAPAMVTWHLDTVAPAKIVISQPAGGALTSADSVLTIAGSCEPGATVSWNNLWTVSGAANLPLRDAIECPLSGSFQVVVSSSVDGIFTWNFLQTDLANASSTSVAVEWTRDSSIPVTPVITSPSTSTVTNSLSTVTISGACVTGDLVTIGGDVVNGDILNPVGSLTLNCARSVFSFTVSKNVDASYVFAIFQTNRLNVDSASAILTWVRDTLAPSAVQLTSPSGPSVTTAGDLVVDGACESGATVLIAGAISTTIPCVSDSFSVTVSAGSDGVYPMGVTQRDAAMNTSLSEGFTWTKNSLVAPTPIISVPSQSPYRSTSQSITIQGTCAAGLFVEIAGILASEVTSPVGSLGQICSPANTFEWTIVVALDDTYSLSIIQTNNVGPSSPARLSWIVDSTAPDVTIASAPQNPTLSFNSVFAFNSLDSLASFRCSIDGAAATTCVSPLTFANLSTGSHLFSVSSVDLAGNVSATVSHQWTSNARKTIALYHFDTATGHLVDSSGYLSPYASALSPSGTPASGTGKFAQADTFTAAAYLLSAHNAYTQNLPNSSMTVEAFVKISSNPTTYYTIASKTDARNNFGWKFQIKKSGTSSKILAFNISATGTTWGTEALSSSCTFSSSAFTHVAVTWSKGTVNFFCGGAKKGSKIIGTAGSTVIFPSTAPLYVGSLAGSANLLGVLDEVRISQILRYTAAFTAPSGAFVGD